METDLIGSAFTVVGTLVGVWLGFFLQNESAKAQRNKTQELEQIKYAIEDIGQTIRAALSEQKDNIQTAQKVFDSATRGSSAKRVGTTSSGDMLDLTLTRFGRAQSRLQDWFSYDAYKNANRFGESEEAVSSKLQEMAVQFDTFYEELYIGTSDMEFLASAYLVGEKGEVDNRTRAFSGDMSRWHENRRVFALSMKEYIDSLDSLVPLEVTARSRFKVSWERLTGKQMYSGDFNNESRDGMLVYAARRLEWVLGRR